MSKLLVVEDDISLGETVMEMLELLSIDAELAQSYKEALEKLKSDTSFTSVLCDYTLGDGNGMDVWAYCKENGPKKFIMASGYGASDLGLSDEDINGIIWEVKPYSFARIQEHLNQ